jgi:hypothetical protein
MLKRRMFLTAPLILALAASGCAMPDLSVDPKLAANLDYIKIVNKPPGDKCRYLGEMVSFRALPSSVTHDVMDAEGSIRARHEIELRQHARQLGANVIDSPLSHNTGYAYLLQVHTFHAC